MIKKYGFKLLIWAVTMMLISVIILKAGRYSNTQYNSDIDNYGPGGTAVFVSLLEEMGYKLKINNTARLNYPEKAQIIAIVDSSNQKDFIKFAKKIKRQSSILALQILGAYNSAGQKEIVGFDAKTVLGKIEPFESSDDSEFDYNPYKLSSAQESPVLLTKELTAVAGLSKSETSTMLSLVYGQCVTNEYIQRADNAKIVMGLVKTMIDPKRPVIINTAFAGGPPPGLIESLGPFAQGAWSQLLVLIVVLFISLSVRFGLAPQSRAQQRNSKELVFGLAILTERKKSYTWALQAYFDNSVKELERRHRVRREKIVARPESVMSAEDTAKFKLAEAATFDDDITEEATLKHVASLNSMV
jgi:hypothetical protein